jgi:hypothetical protein
LQAVHQSTSAYPVTLKGLHGHIIPSPCACNLVFRKCKEV